MASLTYGQAVSLTDKMAAMLLSVKAAVGSVPSSATKGLGDKLTAPGAGTDYGCHLKSNDLITLILSYADEDRVTTLLQQAKQQRTNLSWQAIMASGALPFMQALAADAQQAGQVLTLPNVSDLNTFLLYYNTGAGGPFNALVCPDFSILYNNVFSVAPISSLNVYSPAISNMGALTVGGALAAGSNVNMTLYAGVAISQVTVTGFTGASALVTITGTNHAGQTGRFWTATVAANGVVALVPTVAADILTSVQSIGIAAAMTAGTVTVNGLIPADRTNPPV